MDLSVGERALYLKSEAWRSTFYYFAFVALIIVGIGAVLYFYDRHQAMASWLDSEQVALEEVSHNLTGRFRELLYEPVILASHSELYGDNDAARLGLTRAFVRVANVLPYFNQLRYIDNNGMERVRVDTVNGLPYVVPESKLQNKSDRYYFLEGMKLSSDEVYVSPLDLNVESGEIEQPIRPVIRFVLPVVNDRGDKSGIVVVNFSADELLSEVATYDDTHLPSLMLLNNEGYWLYSEQEGDSWGFQLPHGRRFSELYSDVWARLRDAPEGQFLYNEGLYTYKTISGIRPSPLNDTVAQKRIISPSTDWILISLVDDALLMKGVNERAYTMLIIVVLILVMLTPISRVWGVRNAKLSYAHDRMRTYAAIIEQSKEIVYVVSADGHILFANQAAERCYGYSAEELIGKRPNMFKSGRHPDEFYNLLWQTVTTGNVFEGMLVNKRKDGSLFHEAKHIIPIKLEGVDKTVFVSLGQDLTSMIDSRNKDMLSANRLSQGIQHHFNNLLTVIMGYIQLAIAKAEDCEDESLLKTLAKSLDSAERAQEFVTKVGMINSADKGKSYVLDVAKEVRREMALLKSNLPKGCLLSLYVENDLPLIHGDSHLICSAIAALVDNSLHAIGDQGSIDISLNVMEPVSEVCVNCHHPINGKHLCISVKDNGTGISERQLPHVFDPFFSDKESSLKVAETPGLGLSLVRSVAHIHNGHLLLESEEGVGTTVRILIPLME